MRTYVPVVDTFASLYATIAILSAAVVRAGSGRGQYVDVSLMGAGVAALGNLSQYYLTSGLSPPRIGNALAVKEGFAEVRVPLMQGRPGVHELLADAGYRYSDYEQSGGVE